MKHNLKKNKRKRCKKVKGVLYKYCTKDFLDPYGEYRINIMYNNLRDKKHRCGYFYATGLSSRNAYNQIKATKK